MFALEITEKQNLCIYSEAHWSIPNKRICFQEKHSRATASLKNFFKGLTFKSDHKVLMDLNFEDFLQGFRDFAENVTFISHS